MVIQWLYSSKNEGLPNETDGRLQATKERVFSSSKYLNWHLLLRDFLKAKIYEHFRKNILKKRKELESLMRKGWPTWTIISICWKPEVHQDMQSWSCCGQGAPMLDVTCFCSKAWCNCRTKVTKHTTNYTSTSLNKDGNPRMCRGQSVNCRIPEFQLITGGFSL